MNLDNYQDLKKNQLNHKKINNHSVDIILPNYNKGKFLEEAINSVITQTYKKWKLYIIDDHSNDNSCSVIKKFLNVENITIVKLNRNKGPSFCRNYAMRISKSKYISFLDSDDIWMKDKLEKQIFFMEKNNFSFTFTDYTSFFEKTNQKEKVTHIRDSFNFKKFTRNSSINTTTMIIERSIIKSNRFKKIKLCEDYLFKCILLKNGNVANKLNENLAIYRILSRSRSSQRVQNIFWIWYINKNYNKLNFIENIISIICISINSIKKYGIK